MAMYVARQSIQKTLDSHKTTFKRHSILTRMTPYYVLPTKEDYIY